MNEHLRNLELDIYATIDDIKSAYRRLAKIYHPDMNKTGADRFRSLTVSYNWLLQNHKPKKVLRNAEGYDHYYEVLDPKAKRVKIGLYAEEDVLDNGAVIYIIRGFGECRIFLEKGEKLPKSIELTNIGESLIIDFVGKKFMEG